MKRYTQWGARLFFSATVAFSVPSIYKDGGLLRPNPFWKGLLLTIAAVVGKLVVGLYAGPPLTLSGFLKLGWAMNGRYVDPRFPGHNKCLPQFSWWRQEGASLSLAFASSVSLVGPPPSFSLSRCPYRSIVRESSDHVILRRIRDVFRK